ncbi:MAG: right-handed parallel beta-helix repeat-containing protein, partial [Bacteroidales bacterium]|nr:right-handed parallel beta-helix repeat-containing protein [Bacteroidales bacterium]
MRRTYIFMNAFMYAIMKHKIFFLCFIVLLSSNVFSQQKIFNVRDYGARGDGKALDTKAIQKAIDDCSKAGDGTVLFPAGIYKAGTVYLKSNIRIYLETSAKIIESESMDDFDIPFEQSYTTVTASKYVFLHGIRVKNVTIEGSGIIDGNKKENYDFDQYLRGPLPILFENSQNILVKDFTVQNAPGWAMTFFGCNQVDIIRVKSVHNQADGINVTCCQNVLYDGAYFEENGDDPICIKNECKNGKYENRPDCGFLTENILITNCVVKNCSHPAIKIGTGTAGVFRNITISNCIFDHTGYIFTIQLMRLKLEKTPERVIENLLFTNIIGRNVKGVFDITTMGVDTAAVRNLSFSNITVESDLQRPSVIQGLAEVPINNVRVSNVNVIHRGKLLPYWLKVKHVHGLKMDNIDLDFSGNVETALLFENGIDLELNNVNAKGLTGKKPVIELAQARQVFIHNCFSPGITNFLYVRGSQSKDICLMNNEFGKTKYPILASSHVADNAFISSVKNVDILGFQVNHKINPNDFFQPYVTFFNKDRSGPYFAKIYVNDQLAGSKWLWLDQNITLRDSLKTIRYYKPGERILKIGKIKKQVKVNKSLAQFAYGDTMQIIAPAKAGELTWVKVLVKNIGGEKGTKSIEMIGDGKIVASKKISLKPGEEKIVQLEHRFNTDGSHAIQTGDFEPWNLSTYHNVEAYYYQTKDGEIIIDAGGRKKHYEDQAVAYINNVEGDYVATVKILYQESTTGSYAAVGIVVRNEMTNDTSGGLNRHYRVPKYGSYKIWHIDTDGDGMVDTRSDLGYGTPPVWF